LNIYDNDRHELIADSDFRTGGILDLFNKAARKVTKNSPKVVHYELKSAILRFLKYTHELDDLIAHYQYYKLSSVKDPSRRNKFGIWEKWPKVVLSIEKHRDRYLALKQELKNMKKDDPNSYDDWEGVHRHIELFEKEVGDPFSKPLPFHKNAIESLLKRLEEEKITIFLSPPIHAGPKVMIKRYYDDEKFEEMNIKDLHGYFLKSRKQSLWNGDIDQELSQLATSRLYL
jgi:hypothetical protein